MMLILLLAFQIVILGYGCTKGSYGPCSAGRAYDAL